MDLFFLLWLTSLPICLKEISFFIFIIISSKRLTPIDDISDKWITSMFSQRWVDNFFYPFFVCLSIHFESNWKWNYCFCFYLWLIVALSALNLNFVWRLFVRLHIHIVFFADFDCVIKTVKDETEITWKSSIWINNESKMMLRSNDSKNGILKIKSSSVLFPLSFSSLSRGLLPAVEILRVQFLSFKKE